MRSASGRLQSPLPFPPNPLPLSAPAMQAMLVDTKVACLEVMGTRKNTACSLFFLAPVTSKRLLGSLHWWPQAFLIFLTAAVKCHIVMQNNSKEMYKKSVLHMQICCFANKEQKCDVRLPW